MAVEDIKQYKDFQNIVVKFNFIAAPRFISYSLIFQEFTKKLSSKKIRFQKAAFCWNLMKHIFNDFLIKWQPFKKKINFLVLF